MLQKLRRNIDKKALPGLEICVKMQTDRKPSSKHALKNCQNIIRTPNGIDFFILTWFALFQKQCNENISTTHNQPITAILINYQLRRVSSQCCTVTDFQIVSSTSSL